MAWYDTVPQLDSEIQALERATHSWVNKEQRQFPVDVINLVAKANALSHDQDNKLENERKTRKRRLHESDNSGNSTNTQGNSKQNQSYVLFTISLDRYGHFFVISSSMSIREGMMASFTCLDERLRRN
jgi:vacuolar-type H+-ATPase subunit I/STV1